MPKRGPKIILNNHPMERNLHSSGRCSNHCPIAVVASEKPSISPTAFTFGKGVGEGGDGERFYFILFF